MEEKVESQATEGTDTTATEEQKPAEATNQEPENGQPETTEKDSSQKTYQVLNRDLSSDELYEEYKKTQSYITKLEQERAERERGARKEAETAISQNELLKDVPPNVAEAIKQIVTPVIQEALSAKELEAKKKESDRLFMGRVEKTVEKFSGKNGFPKFEIKDIILGMQDPANDIYDPEVWVREKYRAQYEDALRKDLLRKHTSGLSTEDTVGEPKQPTQTAPSDWAEASRRAASRF